MITVLVEPGARDVGERLELDADEAHHLKVRRGEHGVRVRFRDGAGTGGTGLLEVDGRRHLLTVELVETAPPPPSLVLAVGAGDRERFAWLVEKAAELGVTDVVPLETARTVNVATRVRDGHVEKLARRAREAVKQSGALWAPRVLPPILFEAFVDAPRPGERWLLDAAGRASAGLDAATMVTALVGPEGGFTEEEAAQAKEAGYRPVRIGPHTLRFETAAVAAAALIQTARERGANG
ncbi:MAG TPA: RsmE family RNA methyltransferase [Gemmatimonadales bacterium]|nr:RsmE family RNA methyltransferase [Gemmatimonadales bacterium]